MRTSAVCLLLVFPCAAVTRAAAVSPATRPLIAGADVSMLPEAERAGGVFRRADGTPADALDLLRDGGCNLYRVRLFVNPSPDWASNHGACQDLQYVIRLARRIKAEPGAIFLLDLHHSDTWADPGKQFKPAAWKDLGFDALEKQVHDSTADVLRQLKDAGAAPDMVQVGNEIASGMLWPDGKVLNAPKEQEAPQWQRFARLFGAGARAVREGSDPQHPIGVVLHIHGGGSPGMAVPRAGARPGP